MPLTEDSFTPDSVFPVNKDTDFYIPELPVSTKDARLDELNALAQGRGAGTVYSRDSKGGIVATNTPETRRPGYLQASASPASSASSSVMRSLEEQMAAIEAMPTDQRIKGLIDLQGTVQMLTSQRKEQARLRAEAELGVDNLKQMLEASMADDRRYPQFAQLGTYSIETEDIRNNYQAALSQAQARAASLVQEDSELISVVKRAELFSAFQEKEINTAQSRAAKLAEAADGIKEVASLVLGRPATDLDIYKNYSKFSSYEALSNNPAALMEQTIINKDPGAASILAHVQTAAVAKTADRNSPVYQKVYNKTKQELAIMAGIMTDNNMFETQFLASFPAGVEGQATARSTLTALRRNPKEYEAVRKQTAQAFIQQGAKRDFEENVGDWIMASPDGQLINPFGVEGTPLHTAFVAAKQGGKKVSLAALVAAVKGLPPNQSAAALEELKAAMKNAYEHSSGGVYGRSGDALDMDMLLNQKIIATTPFGKFAKTVTADTLLYTGAGAVLGGAAAPFTAGVSIPASAAVGAGVGLLSGVAKGLYNYTNETGAQ